MNFSKYDNEILELSNIIEINDNYNISKYLNQVLNIKHSIITDDEKFNNELKKEIEDKKKTLECKIIEVEKLILLYKNKKNLVQYPYRLSRMNNDYKTFLSENSKLKRNINHKLNELFELHININDIDCKLNDLNNQKYNIKKLDFVILRKWHQVLIDRIELRINNIKDTESIEYKYNENINKLVINSNTKIENLNKKLYNLKNELKILKLRPNNSEIDKSINKIKVENCIKNIDILEKEIIYINNNLIKDKQQFLENKNFRLLINQQEIEKLENSKSNLIEDNEKEILNIEKERKQLLNRKEKNEEESIILINKKKGIEQEINKLSYDINILKKEYKYNNDLELNLKTKIKIKELYVVNNYKQVYKYYYDIIEEKQIEIIHIKDEIKNLAIINNDDINLRIKIIDNIIDKINKKNE